MTIDGGPFLQPRPHVNQPSRHVTLEVASLPETDATGAVGRQETLALSPQRSLLWWMWRRPEVRTRFVPPIRFWVCRKMPRTALCHSWKTNLTIVVLVTHAGSLLEGCCLHELTLENRTHGYSPKVQLQREDQTIYHLSRTCHSTSKTFIYWSILPSSHEYLSLLPTPMTRPTVFARIFPSKQMRLFCRFRLVSCTLVGTTASLAPR